MLSLAEMVSKKSESISDYVKRVRREKGYSLDEVEARSRGGITNGYISRLENGHNRNPTPEKLKALARGLGVSEKEIFEVARGESPEETADVIKKKFEGLALKFTRLPQDQQPHGEYLVDILEREFDRLSRTK